jgi:hypothetical protein
MAERTLRQGPHASSRSRRGCSAGRRRAARRMRRSRRARGRGDSRRCRRSRYATQVGREQHGALAEAVALDRTGEALAEDRARHPFRRGERQRVDRIEPREKRGRLAGSPVHRRDGEVAELAVVVADAERGGENRTLAERPSPVVGEEPLEWRVRGSAVGALASHRGSRAGDDQHRAAEQPKSWHHGAKVARLRAQGKRA